MSGDDELYEQIRKFADFVLSEARELTGDDEIGYNHAGVNWLDGIIQRQREVIDPKNFETLTNSFGSFLGECIIHSYGGEWTRDGEDIGVKLDGKNTRFPLAKTSKHHENGDENSVAGFTAYPFAKVIKHLEYGDEDSVLSFFEMIPVFLRKIKS